MMIYDNRERNDYFTLMISILVIIFILFCIAMFWILYTLILYPKIKLEKFSYNLSKDGSNLETHLKLNVKNPSNRLLQVLQFQVITTSFQPVFNIDRIGDSSMGIDRPLLSYYYSSSKGPFEIEPSKNETIDMMIQIPFGKNKNNSNISELEYHCKNNKYYWANYRINLAGYFPEKKEVLKTERQFSYLKISCNDLFDNANSDKKNNNIN